MIFVKFILPFIGLAILFTFIYFEYKKKYIFAVIFKGLASLCFLIMGIIFFINKSGDAKPLSNLILIGLILGLLGDILLNLRFVVKPEIGNKIFILGVLSFLAGHILYLVHLIKFISVANNHHLIYIPIIIAVLIDVFISYLIFTKLEVKLSNKIFGVVYILAVSMMMTLSVFNMINGIIHPLNDNNLGYLLHLGIGGILFFASDVILIFNSFGKHPKFYLRISNLTLYYIGQLLISISILLLNI